MNDRIKELETQIKSYATAYYSGDALISDGAFDALVEELRSSSPNSEVLKTGWGFNPRQKVSHRYGLHIGSLSKIHSVGEVPGNLQSNIRISAKLDGLSVVTYFVDGKLDQAVTRGNGSQGMDVTSKVLRICPRIAELDDSSFTGAVRGEVVMPWNAWDSADYDSVRENPSANPRNYAAGLMNRDELSPELKDLKYVTYKVLYSAQQEYSCDSDAISFLVDNGFDVVPRRASLDFVPSDESMKGTYDFFSCEYPCDGLVITSEDLTEGYQEIAYKFEAETKEVVVTKVTWNVTRTGKLAPRVWFDPVELSGAVVKKATAFNAAFIRDNKIGPGAVLKVRRSGEVTPDIVEVVTPAEEENIHLPSECPLCHSALVWSGTDLKCEYEDESQMGYRYISTAAELDGAGSSLYSTLVSELNLMNSRDLVDLLKLIKDSEEFERVYRDLCDRISGEVTQNKVRQILIKLTEDIDPVVLLVACNVPGLSWTTGRQLLEGYPEFIQDIVTGEYDFNRVLNIKGLGWSFVDTVGRYIERLRRVFEVVTVRPLEVNTREVSFKVAITGSLSMKRADFDKLLTDKGIAQSSNFKEIKYLITNHPESTSSKMKKAKDNGVEIISESEFTSKFLA